MTESQAYDPDDRRNFCYRHPDRRSFVLCQRCGRTICPECQTQAPVGVICPECMRAAGGRPARRMPKWRRRLASDTPWVTNGIIAVCLVIYALQWLTQQAGVDVLTGILEYRPFYADPRFGMYQPWRMLTSAFAHLSILHVAMNMLTLWLFGRVLEPMLGHGRFALLYAVSAIGGSAMVSVLTPTGAGVAGASGAIFGLFGAYVLVLRTLRQDLVPMVALIAINLVFGFLNSGISWEGHVGGLLTGALVGWLLLRDARDARGGRRGTVISSAVGVALVALPALLGALGFSGLGL